MVCSFCSSSSLSSSWAFKESTSSTEIPLRAWGTPSIRSELARTYSAGLPTDSVMRLQSRILVNSS